MTSNLSDLLACPRCDKALVSSGQGFRCAGCQIDFPSLENIPWLYSHPTTALIEWRQRLNLMLSNLEKDVLRLSEALQQKNLHSLTRQRLEQLQAATEDHSDRLQALLAPLDLEQSTVGHEMALALRTRLPPDQGLTTYYPNLHRDWAWGDEENSASLALLSDRLGDVDEPQRILVLGSGAGRLAYDLHRETDAELTVALDFNPLFQLAAQRITGGESVELYEFPIAPRSVGDQAVLRTLRAPAPVGSGFHLVLADALHPPFAEAGFDTVVTPWLVDVLPEDFPALCSRINRLLKPQGRWLNFGSLHFHQSSPEQHYSLEECEVLIQDAGFTSPVAEEATIPYMCSPASRHGRRETVVTWCAVKEKNTEKPSRHQALPDWLVEGTDPIPLLDSFRMQAATTRIYALIMSLIDGRRSLEDMAQVMVQQRLVSEEEAEPTIRQFLIKMYDDSKRAARF